jgi:hypothetical protein
MILVVRLLISLLYPQNFGRSLSICLGGDFLCELTLNKSGKTGAVRVRLEELYAQKRTAQTIKSVVKRAD